MQWLSLSYMELNLHDDEEIINLPSLEECKRRCMFWSEGPCKSFDWVEFSPQHNYLTVCYLSHADQHSNPENMEFSIPSDHVENCEGKNTLSQSFDQKNNYIKSGKSQLNVHSRSYYRGRRGHRLIRFSQNHGYFPPKRSQLG